MNIIIIVLMIAPFLAYSVVAESPRLMLRFFVVCGGVACWAISLVLLLARYGASVQP